MKSFNELVNDVKVFCSELDARKSQYVTSLKSIQDKNDPNAKKLSSNEFKKTFTKDILEIINQFGLKNFDAEKVAAVYGFSDILEELKNEENNKQEISVEDVKEDEDNKEDEVDKEGVIERGQE